MRNHLALVLGAACCALFGSSCFPDLEAPAGGQLACPDEQCPDGWQCYQGECRRLDAPPPRCGDGRPDPDEECDCGDGVGDPPAGCAGANSDTEPDRCRTTCRLPTCGDRALDTGEECDDGNLTGGDGCAALCRFEVCGNGILDPGEVCDRGDLVSGDGCSADCLSDETCGNLIVDRATGEGCDCGTDPATLPAGCDGINGDPASPCTVDCKSRFCGNGVLTDGEECDDANTEAGDGCGPSCLFERCGNGFSDPGEACDAGAFNAMTPDFACRPDCTPRRCGDGVPDSDEECDHGLANSDVEPDACRVGCLRARCGDGVRDAAESCDDGNTASGDGCSADCRSNEVCGNGVVDPVLDEECDAGPYNAWNPDAPCRPDCRAPRCGDAVVDVLLGEQCDQAAANSDLLPDACREDCLRARCGDGVVDSGEDCDDGGLVRGDGCSESCRWEFGWNCEPVPPHPCVQCAPYLHGAACDRCAVLVDLDSPEESGDGATWYTALRSVQEGVEQAFALNGGGAGHSGCEVWVAAGTYRVCRDAAGDTLNLRSGVGIYGGFAGGETAREQRDPEGNRTLLQGATSTSTANLLRVVTARAVSGAVLDGLVITGGRAFGQGEEARGAALLAEDSSLTVSRCSFFDNAASDTGGAVHGLRSSLRFEGAVFAGNRAGSRGGAIYSVADGPAPDGSAALATLELLDSTLVNNRAEDEGGGVYALAGPAVDARSLVELRGSLLSANYAGIRGGAVAATPSSASHFVGVEIHDSVLSGNTVGAPFAPFAPAREGGAVAMYTRNGPGSLRVSNSLFSGNDASSGSAIYGHRYMNTALLQFELSGCGFVGNTGTALHLAVPYGAASLRCTACSFVGNPGRALSAEIGATAAVSLDLESSTLVGNGRAIGGNGASVAVSNTVSAGNLYDDLGVVAHHSALQGCPAGEGNLCAAPGLLAGPGAPRQQGQWQAVAFDEQRQQTGLTVAAAMTPGAMRGLFVQPMAGPDPADPATYDARWFQIADNDEHRLWVHGDLRQILRLSPSVNLAHSPPLGAGTPYALFDLRLAADSPCIDAADDLAASFADLEGRARVESAGLGTDGTWADLGAYEQGGAPGGPVRLAAGRQYWASGEGTRSWAEAQGYCARFGGNLADLNDAAENDLVAALLDTEPAWMGAFFAGGWQWSSGEPWSFGSWPGGEPNPGQCAATSAQGDWLDDDCQTARPFVCEKAAVP